MTTRDDAAIALRQAAACEDTYVSPGMALIFVDAVEPIIRADERERIAEAARGTEFWAALAAEIRRVDGNHTLGASRLAEELAPFIATAISRGDS